MQRNNATVGCAERDQYGLDERLLQYEVIYPGIRDNLTIENVLNGQIYNKSLSLFSIINKSQIY